VAFWKAQHLPGLRLTANGTLHDKAEAGSIPVLTTKFKIMKYIFIIGLLSVINRVPVSNHSVTPTTQCSNIIIGDSQSPYVDWGSEEFKLINSKPGSSSLWEGGKTLTWLLSAVKAYKIDTTVCNVAICIGTNGGFNKKDNISGLVNELHVKFPKAKLFVIQGSWGWGGVSNKTESTVRAYYSEFEKLGVTIVEPPIGKIEPHGKKPIYQTIGKNLDNLIWQK